MVDSTSRFVAIFVKLHQISNEIYYFHQVNKAYSDMSLLYLHCALGLCTLKPEHARGNLLMVRIIVAQNTG
jgi:hypothetical protein